MGLRSHVPRGWRLISWTIFALMLVTIGAGLYVVLPPAPRWALAGTVRTVVSDNEAEIATYVVRGGPVQLWDKATGAELDRFLADEPEFLEHAETRDGRYFIAVLGGGRPDARRIAWVDLQERKSWTVEAPLGELDSCLFSPSRQHLAVRLRKVGETQAAYTIVETKTGRLLARFAIPCRPPARQEELGIWPDAVADGIFTEDGRFFAVDRADGEAAAMHVVDTRSGKVTVIPDARLRGVVPGSHSLIAERDGSAWIWDLAAMDWRAPLEADAPDTLRFSADGRWMASVPPNHKDEVAVRFFDLRTGRLHWEFRSITANSEEAQEEQFSPDGRCFLLPTEPAPAQRRLTFYDIENRRMVWQHSRPAPFGVCLFTKDSRTLISALATQVEAIDTVTGQVRFTIDMPFSVQVDPWLSRDGRTLYVHRQPMAADLGFWGDLIAAYWPWAQVDANAQILPMHAYDLASGHELWRLECRFPMQMCFEQDSIVTVHHDYGIAGPPIATTIECWDVPPRKPLGWVIGTPACVGALLLGARAGWRRLRRRAPPGTATPHALPRLPRA